MSKPAGIFKARQFGNGGLDAAAGKLTFLADSTTELASFVSAVTPPTTGAAELTKNDKYCVSRLPALPALLKAQTFGNLAPGLVNGYTDNATRCALAVTPKAINVWPYTATDDTPLTFEFPLVEDSGDVARTGEIDENALQLAILTRPTPGTTLDPGLAIINSISGHVFFYESVQYAPALGMINSQSIETYIGILAAQGEYITMAENVEPAGIAVATSWKRVVLVVLRDLRGTPKLTTLELTKPAPSLFLSGWLGGALAKGQEDLADEIVSIKSGPALLHGALQEIVVQDASGTFKKFVYSVSASGAPFVNHKGTVLYKLASYLEKNVDGLIPGSVLHTKFLDLWPLVQEADTLSDIYVALVAVLSSLQDTCDKKILLLKLQINNSGVLVLSSRQLPSVDNVQDATRPRLFIPKPGHTAFVSIGNSVFMSDLDTASSRPATADFQYYEPKWEDVVKFKSSMQVIGLGYEDQTTDSENPGLVLITAEHGVVRIERFVDYASDLPSDDSDPTDPVGLLKSRIQQAIFYGDASFVDFDVSEQFPLDIVGPAVNAVISEILDSSSPYLPPNFSSTRDSFEVRLKLLRSLIEYGRHNFAETFYEILPLIVEALEKMEVSSNLWNLVDSPSSESAELKEILKTVIKSNDSVHDSGSQDIVRSFFTNSVNEVLFVLTDFVTAISASNLPVRIPLQLLVTTLHDAVHKNEAGFIFGISEIPPFKLWLFDTNLLVKAEEIYTQAYCTKNDTYKNLDTTSGRRDLIQLTETLYFLVTSAVQYMQQTNDDQLHEYMQWYNMRKGAWIDALITRGLAKEALTIAQKYHDFFSVAYVLEKEREQTSPEYVFDKIDFFMNQYGFDFAAKLFDFYIIKRQYHRILVDCKPYRPFLEQYFEANPEKSSQVSWIYYLQARDFQAASQVLMSLSADPRNDNQENKELNFSLAKLTAVAAKAEQGTNVSDATKLDEIAVEAESNLAVIRIQNKLHHAISLFVEGKQELMTLNFFVGNFLNQKLIKAEVQSEIEAFFQSFVELKSLSKEQLISILTSIKPTLQFENVFADALKVAALIANDSTFHEQASEIWKKLLCSTDAWDLITATEGNSDEVNKMRVKETVLFKTLKSVQDNTEIMKVLDDVLEQTREDSMSDGGLWDERLLQLEKDCNINLWIATVRNEAKQH